MEDQATVCVGWRGLVRREQAVRDAPDDLSLIYDIVLESVQPPGYPGIAPNATGPCEDPSHLPGRQAIGA